MSDNTPMDPLPGLEFEEDTRPEPMAGAAVETARKPFPILKVVGGTLGGMFVITVVAYFGLRATATPAPANQFDNAIPQPSMAAAPPPTSVMVSPQGQGMAPQPAAVQQMPQPQAMPLPQPQMAGAQGVASAQVQTPQAGMASPNGVVQPTGGMPQGTTMQPGAGAPATTTQTVQGQQTTGAADASNVTPIAQSSNQPMAAPASTTVAAGPTNQEVLDKLSQLTAQVEILRAKLDAKNTAPQAPAHVVAAEKPKSVDAGDSQASAPKAKAPAQKHAAPAPRQKVPGSAQAKRDAATEDASYVLTGMIGDRAFIAKKGASDVNGGASVVAGDVLEDGRQVVMVDAKQKRVWVKGKRGAEYIGGEASGNE